MRVSCAVPKEFCSEGFIWKLQEMKLDPIVTTQIVRVVYEGDDHQLGARIVEMFAHEVDHDITVDYCDEKPKRKKKH